MSESDGRPEQDEAVGDGPEAPAVADQMRAATRSLRARLSLMRDTDDHNHGTGR